MTSPSPTARRSGGPRTAVGKRRSCQNALKHGLYTDERFLEGAALELGDDSRQFQRLLKGLIEARQPVGALEMALVEDIALLLCKKARADRAELAVQVSNLHHHDLERRKQMIQVGHANSDAAELDVQEHGLRRSLGSPGQYEQVLSLLGGLLAMIDINEFGYRMEEAMHTLYGAEHTLRGAEMDTLRYNLSRCKPEDETFAPAKKAMMRLVAEELAAVGREYELFLHEHVANTRAARMAATAPTQAQWAAIIRQQNSLDRQLERKIRLLMELQRERKSEARESLEPSPPTGDSIQPGMPQISSGEVCDVPKGQVGTPIAGGTAERDEGGSADPRCRGPRFFRGATDKPRTPAPGVRATQFSALLIGMSAVLAAFKKIKNRGNELKDLLQRQGITETVPSKRTHFCADRAATGGERSGISTIVGGRLAVPWAGAILHDPG